MTVADARTIILATIEGLFECIETCIEVVSSWRETHLTELKTQKLSLPDFFKHSERHLRTDEHLRSYLLLYKKVRNLYTSYSATHKMSEVNRILIVLDRFLHVFDDDPTTHYTLQLWSANWNEFEQENQFTDIIFKGPRGKPRSGARGNSSDRRNRKRRGGGQPWFPQPGHLPPNGRDRERGDTFRGRCNLRGSEAPAVVAVLDLL